MNGPDVSVLRFITFFLVSAQYNSKIKQTETYQYMLALKKIPHDSIKHRL